MCSQGFAGLYRTTHTQIFKSLPQITLLLTHLRCFTVGLIASAGCCHHDNPSGPLNEKSFYNFILGDWCPEVDPYNKYVNVRTKSCPMITAFLKYPSLRHTCLASKHICTWYRIYLNQRNIEQAISFGVFPLNKYFSFRPHNENSSAMWFGQIYLDESWKILSSPLKGKIH